MNFICKGQFQKFLAFLKVLSLLENYLQSEGYTIHFNTTKTGFLHTNTILKPSQYQIKESKI